MYIIYLKYINNFKYVRPVIIPSYRPDHRNYISKDGRRLIIYYVQTYCFTCIQWLSIYKAGIWTKYFLFFRKYTYRKIKMKTKWDAAVKFHEGGDNKLMFYFNGDEFDLTKSLRSFIFTSSKIYPAYNIFKTLFCIILEMKEYTFPQNNTFLSPVYNALFWFFLNVWDNNSIT